MSEEYAVDVEVLPLTEARQVWLGLSHPTLLLEMKGNEDDGLHFEVTVAGVPASDAHQMIAFVAELLTSATDGGE